MEMLNNEAFSHLVARQRPTAAAVLRGNDRFPEISGTVRFYPADKGTLVVAEVFRLPVMDGQNRMYGPFHAFHLHEGGECGSGAGENPFAESKGHFNPTGREHPFHAGDFPPLLSNGGYAYMSFYTGRFTPREAVGHAVIIHQNADDFHTQPSGNAGEKLACGVVMQVTP